MGSVVADAVALAVALGVAVAVALALAVGKAFDVVPVGSGWASFGGGVFCGVHAAMTAGVSIAALITERTTSLMGERPWYDMIRVYEGNAPGAYRVSDDR